MAKLPMAQANNKGVLTSLGLTLALVTSELALANIKTIDFISDLKLKKEEKKNVIKRKQKQDIIKNEKKNRKKFKRKNFKKICIHQKVIE